jgi:hypothetical protein
MDIIATMIHPAMIYAAMIVVMIAAVGRHGNPRAQGLRSGKHL